MTARPTGDGIHGPAGRRQRFAASSSPESGVRLGRRVASTIVCGSVRDRRPGDECRARADRAEPLIQDSEEAANAAAFTPWP